MNLPNDFRCSCTPGFTGCDCSVATTSTQAIGATPPMVSCSDTGAIMGGVAAGIFLLLLLVVIIAIIVFYIRRKKDKTPRA